jgi:mRNA-degrading endonuclease RelE of RelBE toxin-antitoxin system
LKPKFNVVLARQTERFYKKLEGKEKATLRECLISLEQDPYAGKRLHGDLKDNFSLRVGKLRIIYSVSEKDKAVYVIVVGPRRNVYQ